MTFKPVKPQVTPVQLGFRPSAPLYKRITVAANASGITINRFLCQAVQYALDHMEDEPHE